MKPIIIAIILLLTSSASAIPNKPWDIVATDAHSLTGSVNSITGTVFDFGNPFMERNGKIYIKKSVYKDIGDIYEETFDGGDYFIIELIPNE